MPSMAERAGQRVGAAANNFVNSPFASRFREWGWKGVGGAAKKGALFSLGFMPDAAGKTRFLGMGGMRSVAGGLGIAGGASLGYAIGGPLGAIAGGLGGGMALGRLGAGQAGGMAFKGLGVGFAAMAAYEGWQQEGLWGATKGVAGHAASWALFDVGMGALKTAFKGTGVASLVSGVGTVAMNPLTWVAIAAGYGAYKGAQYLAKRGREARKTEFVGDTAAFNTQAAYTMRQRSLMEMNRGYGSARTLLAQEASLMHV